jgi:hypothetical protein
VQEGNPFGISGGFDDVKNLIKKPHNWYWGHLGSGIGRAIGEAYRAFHPRAFNDQRLATIVAAAGKSLGPGVKPLERPDIYDPATGALWEIKPEGSEVLGASEASYYVTSLGKSQVPAHLGDPGNIQESVGASGFLNYGIYRISFNATLPGVITYRASLRPELSSALGGAAAGAGAGSLLNILPRLVPIP